MRLEVLRYYVCLRCLQSFTADTGRVMRLHACGPLVQGYTAYVRGDVVEIAGPVHEGKPVVR